MTPRSGTWSLVGTEVPVPVLTAEALAANLTNEGGAAGSVLLHRNAMGLWLVQAGPAEAAAMGNVLVQAMALGRLASLQELRAIARASVDVVTYEPRPDVRWDDALGLLTRLVG